jgi:hypothetical protein
VLVETTTPAQRGLFTLEVDLVHEHVRWFGCEQRSPIAIETPGVARYPRLRGDELADELRAEVRRLRAEEHELVARARELERITGSRRYRVVEALVRPLDELRRRAGKRG